MEQTNCTPIELIKKLSQVKSETGGTSLITLYVPSLSNLSIVSNQINSELSTSQNIKSKTVRNSVQNALKCAQLQLKSLKSIAPENGLVICSGAVESYF